MANVKWTKEQEDAILKKGSNILVAAAAGSGKTAVLVERIIRKIVNDKIDIDKILVVTFTSAAASEMRERILEAIYKKIDENPEDVDMQRQVNLLNKASICTIDSFCLDVVKNNFFEIDVSANSRIADGAEVNILKQETLDEIFEEKYISNDKDFLELIDRYTKYNRDEDLEKLILKIYNYIQSDPFPESWLQEKIEMFKEESEKENFSDTIWGKEIIKYSKSTLEDCVLKLEQILSKMNRFPELERWSNIIENDKYNYNLMIDNLNNWDKTVEVISAFEGIRWITDKKVENDLKDESKKIRDKVKLEFEDIKDYMPYNSSEAINDIKYMYEVLVKLKDIILEFGKRYYEKKRERNIMDFGDMEHLALNILVRKDENGNIVPTEVAKRYAEKFEEIAIDEYQDSNLVQECILTSVSKGNNIFMVGDVKQSIYKFRQARPELFLQKYKDYKLNPEENENRKIQLFKNFRSRQNVLDITNLVFEDIMSIKLGDIDYNENEFLNLGASYENVEKQDFRTELNIIEKKEDNNDIWKDNNEQISSQITEVDEEDGANQTERVEDVILEARFVARKIKELIDGKFQIIDKKEGKREIKFKDIAVIMKSPNAVAPIYEKEILELGMNAYSDSSDSYLDTIEIATIMSVLKIINNPMQDISLVTVLRSVIANFTDNDLVEISFFGTKDSFYDKLINASKKSENNQLVNKINSFLKMLYKWTEEEKYKPLDELIWQIYIDTGYLNYVSLMPNGELRVANLKMLFEKAKTYESASFKGLYNFINFIDKVKLSPKDMGAAKIIGENENVVRIMSIHKSKGLEFPVVILAGVGKQFNFQDLYAKLLLHQDFGIGPQYIDDSKYIDFPTLAKKAISLVAKREIISEEMRVLYVALTRAKEKLIIIGMQKDVNKNIMDKSNILEIYKGKDDDSKKINSNILQKCTSYLDWFEYVYVKEGIKATENLLNVNIISKEELYKKLNESKVEKNDVVLKINDKAKELKDIKIQEEINKKLEWKYNFKNLENVPTKTSVTKIKELSNKNNLDYNNIIEIESNQDSNFCKVINLEKNAKKEHINNTATIKNITSVKPKFINEEGNVKLTGAEKGTLMHLCVQKMNEQIVYDFNKVKEMIDGLTLKELITPVEAENINIYKLLEYSKSELWNELKKAKDIKKEQPFYINIPVREVYETNKNDFINNEEIDENILVQGIIDLYFIDKDDRLILVDYKTDYVEKDNKNQLADKYRKQLELYKDALEQSLGIKVDCVYIYSLWLNESIEII